MASDANHGGVPNFVPAGSIDAECLRVFTNVPRRSRTPPKIARREPGYFALEPAQICAGSPALDAEGRPHDLSSRQLVFGTAVIGGNRPFASAGAAATTLPPKKRDAMERAADHLIDPQKIASSRCDQECTGGHLPGGAGHIYPDRFAVGTR